MIKKIFRKNLIGSMPTLSMSELNRKLTIQTNVVSRYRKEVEIYEREWAKEMERVEEMMKKPDVCPHELAKHKEIAEESGAMIRECKSRLLTATSELNLFINRHKEEDFQPEVFSAARKALLNAESKQ